MKSVVMMVAAIWFLPFMRSSALSVMLDVPRSQLIEQWQHEIAGIANRIIQEEIEHVAGHTSTNVPQCKKNKHLHVTVLFDWSVKSLYDRAVAHSLHVLYALQGAPRLHDLMLLSQPILFGRDGEFIVLPVQDTSRGLFQLREQVGKTFMWLEAYHHNLQQPSSGLMSYVYRFIDWVKGFFGVSKMNIFSPNIWNRYAYNPHVTLCTLPRKNIIKYAQRFSGKGKYVWQRIKQRVQQEVNALFQGVSAQPLQLTTMRLTSTRFKTLARYNLA